MRIAASVAALLILSLTGAGAALFSLDPATELVRPLEPARLERASLQSRHEHHDDEVHKHGEPDSTLEVVEVDPAPPTSSPTAVPTHAHRVDDEHSQHHSHAPPLVELNETLILLTHSPDPPSYLDYDQSDEGKPALLYIHIVLMSFAFFGLLPLGAPSSPSLDSVRAVRAS